MYWRVRKISPEQMLRQYSIHIIVAVSLLGNLFQFVTRPKKETVSKEMKNDFGVFAKQVTTHLLDTSYINYLESTSRLQSELSDSVKQRLRQDGVLPGTTEEMKANLMEFTKARRVCAMQFKQVEIKDPNQQGMIPVEVQGVVVVHSADESAQQPFHLAYMVGLRKGDPPSPVVVQMQELAPSPVPTGGPGQ
ncbi:MAG: hypothetical protein SGJ27_10305 [Candidatus Melainabacteria bacterium]|nr:hypothetical protein [Candidatus Melainabacteria bacterium]